MMDQAARVEPTNNTQQTEGKDPSFEDKKMYDLIMANVQEFVSAEGNSERIISAIQTGDPAEMVGRQAGSLLSQIVESAAENGNTPTAEVAVAASAGVISEIIELGIASGALEPGVQEDKEFLAKAMQSLRQSVGAPEPTGEAPPNPTTPSAQPPAPGPRGMLGAAQGGM